MQPCRRKGGAQGVVATNPGAEVGCGFIHAAVEGCVRDLVREGGGEGGGEGVYEEDGEKGHRGVLLYRVGFVCPLSVGGG